MVSNTTAAVVARVLRIAAVGACAVAVLAWPGLLIARSAVGDLAAGSSGSSHPPPVDSSLAGLWVFIVALTVAAAFAAAAAVLATSRPIGVARIAGAVIAAAVTLVFGSVGAWVLGIWVVLPIVDTVVWFF